MNHLRPCRPSFRWAFAALLLAVPGNGLRDMGEGWLVQLDSHDGLSAKNDTSSKRPTDWPYMSPDELNKEYSIQKTLAQGEWSDLSAVRNSDKKEVLLRCLTNQDTPKLKFLKLNGDDVNYNRQNHFVNRETGACSFMQTFKGKINGLPGSNRIPSCFDGYFPSIYHPNKERSVCCSTWSYAGPYDLEDFYLKHAKDDETALMVFKQLLEGLALLGSLDPPVVHRRIMPWSISVSGEDKGHALLINSWQVVKEATEEDLCGGEERNKFYGPAEDMVADKKCPDLQARFSSACGNMFHWTDEKICGSKFDVFSAGVIFMEIVYNIKKGADVDKYRNTYSWRRLYGLYEKHPRMDHDALDKLADKDSAAKEFAKKIGLDLAQDTPLAKAFPHMVKTLYKNPRLRPSPAELLKLDVFKDIKTPTATY